MARYRQGETRWVHAACVAGAYLVLVAGLFTLQVGAGLNVPASVAVAMPPLVYAALAVLLLREAPFVRRLSWVGSACLVHVVLGALAAVELTWAGGLSLPAALAQVFVLFPPGAALTLVATPLTMAAFGLTASRPPRPADTAPRPAAPARAKPLSPPAPARAARSIPDTAAAPAPPRVAASVGSPAAAPAPPIVPARTPAPVAAPPPVVPPVPPAVSRPPKPAHPVDDGMVRVSFARIASQLPADAFVLPFERLGESLREPHRLLVPRRVVLSQMRDGTVAITWAHIASQFPDLALGMSDDEFRKQYPDLKLWLPMDEVAPQLPSGSVAPGPEPERVDTAPARVTPPSTGFAAAPLPPPRVATPAPAVPAPSRVAPVGRDVVGRMVGCFSGVGTFEAVADRIVDTSMVTLVEPRLPREAVTECAARLWRALAGASADVVTLRTEHAVVVVAVAATPIVVAAPLPGAPVALLALCAARAAAAAGAGAPSLPAPVRRALEPVPVDARGAAAAQALRSLGAIAATVFADGSARVNVLNGGGGDDKAVAALALNLCDALGDGGALGRLRGVVFRRGTAYTLVRPLAGTAGVLAVAGSVTRPGRLLREADRAAAALEAP